MAKKNFLMNGANDIRIYFFCRDDANVVLLSYYKYLQVTCKKKRKRFSISFTKVYDRKFAYKSTLKKRYLCLQFLRTICNGPENSKDFHNIKKLVKSNKSTLRIFFLLKYLKKGNDFQKIENGKKIRQIDWRVILWEFS